MIAQAALRQFGPELGFETITFIPAGNPPHRHHENDLLDARRRLKMVQLATADHPAFRVSELETRRSGKCYTAETLQDLLAQGLITAPTPFIIGADALQNLASWHRPDFMAETAYFLQAPRPGCEPVRTVQVQVERQAITLPLRTSAIDMPMLALSSSWIRQTLRENPDDTDGLRYFLPEPVRQFIADNRLYR